MNLLGGYEGKGGSAGALSFGRAHSITGLRNRRTLALFGVLVLVILVLAGREAWAQELPQEEAPLQSTAAAVVNQHTVVIDGEVIEPVAGALPIENIPLEETPSKASPADPAPQPVVRYGLVVSPEPTLSAPEPEPSIGTNLAPEPVESGMDLAPVLPVESAPPPVEQAPEPAVLGENVQLPASVAPAIPGFEETEYRSPSDLEATEGAGFEPASSDTVEVSQGAAADVPGDVAEAPLFRLTVEDEGLVGTAPASLYSGGEADLISQRTGDSGFPSGGTEGPSRSATQQSSPFTLPPVGGGSFPLTGGDMGSGGVHLLLLCVLVSGLVVLRRDGGLSWVFWEPPKPSSAPLLPLERPG